MVHKDSVASKLSANITCQVNYLKVITLLHWVASYPLVVRGNLVCDRRGGSHLAWLLDLFSKGWKVYCSAISPPPELATRCCSHLFPFPLPCVIILILSVSLVGVLAWYGSIFGCASRILHTVARLYEGVDIHRQIVICYGGTFVSFCREINFFSFSIKINGSESNLFPT